MHLWQTRFLPAFAAAMVFSVIPAVLSASPSTTCRDRAQRPAFGIGINGIASELDVSQALDDPDPYVSTRIGGGFGLSIDGSLPLRSVPFVRSWSVRAAAGVTRFGAERITFDRTSYQEVGHLDAGAAPVQRLQFGVVRGFGDGRGFCGYGGFSGGVFRLSYNGVTTSPASVAGVLGFDMPIGMDSPNSVSVEFELNVASNHSHPPVNAYDIVTIGATVVFRHRF